MNTYKLTLVYEASVDPLTGNNLPTEREEVNVPAESLEQARKSAMAFSHINPRGRIVRTFDASGNELFGNW